MKIRKTGNILIMLANTTWGKKLLLLMTKRLQEGDGMNF
jgi:hypothetical protein